MIYFYLSQYFTDIQEQYRPEFLGGKELDIYLPALHVGIEYDGYRWHQDRTDDEIKNEISNEVENNIQNEISDNTIKDEQEEIDEEIIEQNDTYGISLASETDKTEP